MRIKEEASDLLLNPQSQIRIPPSALGMMSSAVQATVILLGLGRSNPITFREQKAYGDQC